MHPSQETDRKILSSWKDIAAYMGRGVRTVQRYEHLGLPVIRLNGHFQSSVMAFTNEIDAWIRETAMRSFVPIMPIGPAEWERLSTLVEKLQGEIEDLRKVASTTPNEADRGTRFDQPAKAMSAGTRVG